MLLCAYLAFILPGNYPDYRGNYPYSPILGRYHQNNGNAVILSARGDTSCIRGNYPWPKTTWHDGKMARWQEAYTTNITASRRVGNYPHRRAHHIDRRLLSSLLIDDDGLVATWAVGEVVSGRLFVHDGNANAMSIVVDDGCC